MKLPRYPKYKDSGVKWMGQVPEDWKVLPLKFLTKKIGSGITPRGGSEVYSDEGVLFLRSQNVYDDGLHLDEVAFIPLETDEEMSSTRVKPGDILLNITGASLGRTALVPAGFAPANVNQHVCIIRLLSATLTEFVSYAMKSAATKGQIEIAQNGAAREGLNFVQIGGMFLALPAEDEEAHAISQFLDRERAKIDALVAEQQRLIELLKEKRQAIISHAVTRGLNPSAPMKASGNDWFGPIPSSWKPVSLRRLIVRIEQGWSPVAEDREPTEGEWAVLKLSAVKGGEFSGRCVKTLNSNEGVNAKLCLQDGDFLLTRANTPELVGDTCIVAAAPSRTVFSDLIYRLVLAKCELIPEYLNLYLRSDAGRVQIERDARGSSQSMVKLSHDHIKNWFIPLPNLEEQRNIIRDVESRLEKLDCLIAEANSAIALLNERCSALITAAVTGQIDVRNYRRAEARAVCQ